MDVVNPATGERIDSYEEHAPEAVEDALATASDAFDDWRARSIREREELLSAAADVLRANKREYAETMTSEMGKPIS